MTSLTAVCPEGGSTDSCAIATGERPSRLGIGEGQILSLALTQKPTPFGVLLLGGIRELLAARFGILGDPAFARALDLATGAYAQWDCRCQSGTVLCKRLQFA